MIELIDISKTIGQFSILNDISFSIKDGEFIALTGKSGSGKSTLLYVISTLDTPSSGIVRYAGEDINGLDQKSLHAFRNKKIGFVFQFHHLLPELTTLENVILPARKTGQHENPEVLEYAITLLEEFGIGNKKDKLPGQLSGGERQRVALARALIMKPEYVFADEPTGNLDSKNGRIVMDFFKKANKAGTTIVMVTHDQDYAAIASRQIVLVDGKLEKKQKQRKLR